MERQKIERIKHIDRLIRIKGTGSPAQLAARIGMSERSIYLYLDLMRHIGAPIKFDAYRQTYYYEREGKLTIDFVPK